jgi:glycosyltransferase involved in cell wall biosynthesis
MSESSGYIIVTAVKNESAMLDGLFQSVMSQTLRPVMWLIADDDSTDDGYEQAKRLAASDPWIRVVTRGEVPSHPWARYGSAVAFGFGKAVEAANDSGLEYRFVAVLDADTVVEKDYFERLMEAFGKGEKVAIASGMITTEGGQGLEGRPSARGCGRLYDRRFLEEAGGFPIAASPDTVLEIKARNRGFTFAVDPGARGLHRRKSTNITDARGLRSLGVIRYTMGMDMLSALAWSVAYSQALGLRSGVAFMGGYFEAIRGKYTRTDDAEVLRHFRGSWKRFLSVSETRRAIRDMLAVQL